MKRPTARRDAYRRWALGDPGSGITWERRTRRKEPCCGLKRSQIPQVTLPHRPPPLCAGLGPTPRLPLSYLFLLCEINIYSIKCVMCISHTLLYTHCYIGTVFFCVSGAPTFWPKRPGKKKTFRFNFLIQFSCI